MYSFYPFAFVAVLPVEAENRCPWSFRGKPLPLISFSVNKWAWVSRRWTNRSDLMWASKCFDLVYILRLAGLVQGLCRLTALGWSSLWRLFSSISDSFVSDTLFLYVLLYEMGAGGSVACLILLSLAASVSRWGNFLSEVTARRTLLSRELEKFIRFESLVLNHISGGWMASIEWHCNLQIDVHRLMPLHCWISLPW